MFQSEPRLANPGSLFGPSPVGAIGDAIKSHGFVCFSEAAGQSGRPSRIGTVTTPPAVSGLGGALVGRTDFDTDP
jgi:hypothetical protein